MRSPLKDLNALQGSLGTSPPLFVPSSTGPSHDVIAFFLKGFKLANYNKPFLSKQPPLKEIFLCCTLGYPHSCRFLNLPIQTHRGLTLPGFFSFFLFWLFPPWICFLFPFFFFFSTSCGKQWRHLYAWPVNSVLRHKCLSLHNVRLTSWQIGVSYGNYGGHFFMLFFRKIKH